MTTDYVFDETVTLVRYRMGLPAAIRVGEAILRDPGVDLVRVEPDVLEAAWSLFASRPDKRYSFTDCTSFAVMKQLSLRDAIALDDDFRQEGFTVHPSAGRG